MSHEVQRQEVRLEAVQDDLAEAYAVLRDPAKVAPVDMQKFGSRLANILMQADVKRRRTTDSEAGG